jgi:hypothetical protein
MQRRLFLAAAAAALLLTVPPVSAQTVDEIIGKYVQATGGLDKLRAVKSLRMTGKMVMGQGMEAPFMMEIRRPDSVRTEFVFQGMTGIQAFDGKQGWQLMPFMGKTDPEPVPPDAIKQMQEQSDFEGPLVAYKEKGHQVELIGQEDVEGAKAWVVKCTLKSGDIRKYFIDAEYFLPIKVEAKMKMQGQEIEGETTLGDYKEVGGLKFPYSMDSKQKGAPAGQQIVIDKIDLNPALEDSRFKMPEVKKPAASPSPAPAPDEKKNS